MADYSILIADADPDIIQQISGVLRANGFQASGTSAGGDALSIYKKESPDLVIADQELVDMDGLQLLSNLKDFDPKAKVVITTSSANKDSVATAFRLGALEFLEKPLDHQFLVSKLRDLLAREDRALEGDLEMMSLASIIQINCEERNQARLTLNNAGQSGTLYFNDGEVVHAESGGVSGEEALYQLLGWEAGSFRLKMDAESPTRTITKAWSGLLLEGMRRIDESTAGWSLDRLEDPVQTSVDRKNPIQERIVKALGNLREVNSALICSTDGTILAMVNNSDPESEVAFTTFLHNQAELISGFLDAGELKRIVLSGSERRIYLQKQDDHLLMLSLAKKASAETVFESVGTIYKRYKTA